MEKIKDLITRAKEGENSAREKIYQNYFLPLFRYIFFWTKNKEDSEDILQDTFLRVFDKLKYFENKNFSAWLYKIAKNKIIDYARKRKKYFLTEGMDSMAKEEEKTEIILEKKEITGRIGALIDGLSPKQKEVIVLRFFNEFSGKEIAEITGYKEEAIRSLQYRAIKFLRQKLKEEKLL